MFLTSKMEAETSSRIFYLLALKLFCISLYNIYSSVAKDEFQIVDSHCSWKAVAYNAQYLI